MDKTTAVISEIFSSLQGEGVFVGAKQIFVRFKACNMSCDFCDESGRSAGEVYTPERLMNKVSLLDGKEGPHHSVSLTGGEPLCSADFLSSFLPLVRGHGMKPYLETNGTLPAELARVIDFVDIVAMDIKLPSSTGERAFWSEHFEFLKIALKKTVFVKAVVTPETTGEDIGKAISLVAGLGKQIPFILQPASPVKKSDRRINEETLLKFMEIGLSNNLECVRVIPQVHKIVGIK